MPDRPPQDSLALLRQALAHHQASRLPEAESLYRQVLDHEPDHPEALRLMGVLARQRGQLDAARSFLEHSVKVKPESPRAHYELALVLLELKEMESAITALRQAVELQPLFPEAYCALGNAYAACWYLDKARGSYQTALSQNASVPGLMKCLEFVGKQARDISSLAEFLKRPAKVPANPASIETGANLQLDARELIPHLLNELGLTAVGVEIGVKEGLFSEHLLQHWNGRLLRSIDPWREFPKSEYRDSANVSQAEQDALYRATVKKLMPYAARSVIWRLTSTEAADLIPDNSLDFCYLDADHSHHAVRQDLQTWYEKVKSGGIIAGHDYIPDGTYSFGTFGVRTAVTEFVRARNLDLVVSQEKVFPSWLVRKS